MTFHIAQLGPGSNERIVREKSYATLQESRGLRGYWWCRDRRGRTRFIYVVN